jgi:hypothetical protein
MRSILHVLGAIAGAYLVVAVLVYLGTLAATSAFGLDVETGPDTAFLVANMLLSFLAAVVGGYLAARFAPHGLMAITVAGLMLVLVVLGAVTARMAGESAQPVWYLAVVVVMGASAVLVGAMVERSLSPGGPR